MITDHYLEDEYWLAYDEMLDETCSEVKIGNLSYSPSQVLKAVDPIAYEIGFGEYMDYLQENN